MRDKAHVRGLISTYIDPTTNYAGLAFDCLEPNDPFSYGISDLFALNFLDTPLRVSAYRQFEHHRAEIEAHLKALDPTACLWNIRSESDPVYSSAVRIYELFRNWKVGIGSTRASKLLARKRPHLIPIQDSRVNEFYGIGAGDEYWLPLAAALADPELRTEIDSLWPAGAPGRVSLLRVLDIAIWMHQGDGRAPGISEMAQDDPDAKTA